MGRTWLFAPLSVLLLASGCVLSGQADTDRVRTALDLVAAAVDPAYDAAMTACVALERAEVAAARAGTVPVERARAELVSIRQRCDRTRAVFEAIRQAHDRATQLVNDGKLDEAAAQLERVREMWRSLRGAR